MYVLIRIIQALTAADVGIAMGSGSDIALSSAKFVLLSSNLHSLLILTDLSRKVFKRIKFNFVRLRAAIYFSCAHDVIPTGLGDGLQSHHAAHCRRCDISRSSCTGQSRMVITGYGFIVSFAIRPVL